MYALQLCSMLHRTLASPSPYQKTEQRFESLRGYGLLPAGRENAGLRLTDEQIASAVLGFVPTLVSWAGHVSLIAGGLRPVGGPAVSVTRSANLLEAVAAILASDDACKSLVSLSIAIVRKCNDDEYSARCVFEEDGERKVASYVSSMAVSLLHDGADIGYDHERMNGSSARQLMLTPEFFRELRREVFLSCHLDLPLQSDWHEYESEEERAVFNRKLGARAGSCFLNLAVDTNVTWPKEPTRAEFGGHRFVMFPPTKDNSHSISIDLTKERISAKEARTLLNRFLSLMSWCDDRHAVLKDGWSGNPVPVPIQRSNGAFHTASPRLFARSLPTDTELLQRLAYYREGLNARHAGLVTFAVLSFYKVFEKRQRSRNGAPNPTKLWIAAAFDAAVMPLAMETIQRFDADRGGVAVEQYLVENCRVATAHASAAAPSDADASPEIRRLHSAAEIVHALARHHITTDYGLSQSHFSD